MIGGKSLGGVGVYVTDGARRQNLTPSPGMFVSSERQQIASGSGDSKNHQDEAMADAIYVCLIDSYILSGDCISRAFECTDDGLAVTQFSDVPSCIRAEASNIDVIIFYSHDNGNFERTILPQVIKLREAFGCVPILILSDVGSALVAKNIGDALRSGVQGFIPTRITNAAATLAAIRFIKEGGTFAPIELLLEGSADREPAGQHQTTSVTLTQRQFGVLSKLREGKSNREIANELDITESTVKAHVRSIMRKMGASSRTHAVYLAQRLDAEVHAAEGQQ